MLMDLFQRRTAELSIRSVLDRVTGRKMDLTCPVCGLWNHVPETWLQGTKPLRCGCKHYTFYPEAEQLRRSWNQEGRG